MEDQRNFGEATFKTYSTPLQRASPFRLEAGQRLRQSMTIDLVDDRRAVWSRTTGGLEDPPRRPTGKRVPIVGLGQANDDVALSGNERVVWRHSSSITSASN